MIGFQTRAGNRWLLPLLLVRGGGGGGGGAGQGGMGRTSRNISIIWLSLFCLVGLLPPVVILYFAVMGMNWVRRESKPIFQRARQGSDLVKRQSG